jgi:hypothetical protein
MVFEAGAVAVANLFNSFYTKKLPVVSDVNCMSRLWDFFKSKRIFGPFFNFHRSRIISSYASLKI